jgi:hypothetical protein
MEKQNGTTFHLVLNPAFILSFVRENTQCFQENWNLSFSRDAILGTLTAFQLTDKSVPKTVQQNSEESIISSLENTLPLPSVTVKPKRKIDVQLRTASLLPMGLLRQPQSLLQRRQRSLLRQISQRGPRVRGMKKGSVVCAVLPTQRTHARRSGLNGYNVRCV